MLERLGRYELDAVVAEGGMARIYRAHTVGLGGVEKVVAIKRLRAQLRDDDELLRMLVDEARLMALMAQKNICQVYGLERDGGEYFIVMEYVEGCNLSELCRYLRQQNRVLPPEAAVYIAIEALSGLSYAHRLQDLEGRALDIIHRDINPQNILLSREGEVKLIDFGIAKATVQSTKTQAGTIKGKINYMSPEQARGDKIEQSSDVFAMAAVLYEMLTGEMLYPLSLDDMRLMQAVKMAQFKPLSELRLQIPLGLRQILNKALRRDTNQRYASSREFLLALVQFFNEQPRRFDSIQLSMLVDSCVEHQKKVEATAVSDFGAQSSAPPLYLAAGVRNETDAPHFEDSPTSVYDKGGLQKLVSELEAMNVRAGAGALGDEEEQAIHAHNTDTVISSVKKDSSRSRGGALGILKIPFAYPIVSLLLLLTVSVALLVVLIINEDSISQAANKQVSLRSTPEGAQIFIDGQNTRMLTPTSVPSGKKIVLKKTYYVDEHVDLSIKNPPPLLNIALSPKRGKLIVTTQPSGAQIYMNGNNIGYTPQTIDAKKGHEYEFILSKPDYRTERRALFWGNEAQDELYLEVELTRD
ncbi:MAG: serine/threonine-protein kinase [Bradymonadales bacterium]